MYKIGEVVPYVAINREGDVTEGEGVLRTVTTDQNGRLVARIAVEGDGDNVITVEYACVDPQEMFVEEYKAMRKKCKEIETKANAELKRITDEANADIDALHDLVVGKPVLEVSSEQEGTNA